MNVRLVMARDAGDAPKERASRLAVEEAMLYGMQSEEALAAVCELVAAASHCEELLMKYGIDRIDGEELSEAALALLRSALRRVEGGEK